jgi:thymidylate synthase (FAD)
MDLHNLLHFLALRMDSHAQQEIRSYAHVIGNEIVARWVPLTWEAFQDYRRQAMNLSRIEAEIITALGRGGEEGRQQARIIAEAAGWLTAGPRGLKRHRERIECEQKLERLNLPRPW